MAVDFLHFLANLTLAMLLMRFLTMKLSPSNPLKPALAYIF